MVLFKQDVIKVLAFLVVLLTNSFFLVEIIQENLTGTNYKNDYELTDWVYYKDTEQGVLMGSGYWHPLAPSWGNLFVVNDSTYINQIEYIKIKESADIQSIFSGLYPGIVLNYQINEKGSIKSKLVELSYKPILSGANHPVTWNISIVFNIIIILISFFFIYTFFPLVKQSFLINLPYYILILLALGLFLVQLLRQLSVVYQVNPIYILAQELLKYAFFILIFLSYSLFIYLIFKKKHLHFIILTISYLLVIFLSNFIFVIYKNNLNEHRVLFFLLLNILFIILFLYNINNTINKNRLLTNFLLLILLIIMYNTISKFYFNNFGFIILNVFLIYPLIHAIVHLFQFGKNSMVITQVVVIFFGVITLVAIYIVLHSVLLFLKIEGVSQKIIEIFTIILLVIILRYIYVTYQATFRKYFISERLKREAALNQFLVEAARISNSTTLLEQSINALKSYISTDDLYFGLISNVNADLPDKITLNTVAKVLVEQQTFWSRAKELSSLKLAPAFEKVLIEKNCFLLFARSFPEEDFLILWIGKRKKGVYNLSQVENCNRVLQQIRLNLEIINLLENEKILIEKTMEANLIALRAQINPHFLFNTFNSISDLIHHSPEKAEQVLEQLSWIFRYTLKFSKETFVTIENELSLVKTYLQIEQTRFGKRLNIELTLDESLYPYFLPAFLIQTVVENTIKHGISKKMGAGIIKIKMYRNNNCVIFEIYDNGPGVDLARVDKGTGLKNILSRIKTLYKDDATIEFINTGNGTLVIINLPLHHHNQNATNFESPNRR